MGEDVEKTLQAITQEVATLLILLQHNQRRTQCLRRSLQLQEKAMEESHR